MAVACGSDSVPSAATVTAAETTQAPTTEVQATTEATATTTTTVVADPLADFETDVLAAFEKYREELLAEDGQDAVGSVTASTLDWYGEILEGARTADEAALLEELSLGDALGVVAMRGSLSDEIASIADGEELFVRGVEEGLVGSDVATMQLDRVQPGEDGEAFGVVGGFPLMRFMKEDGVWRVDLEATSDAIFSAAPEDQMIQSLTGGSGVTRLELFESLALFYGTSWDSLRQPR